MVALAFFELGPGLLELRREILLCDLQPILLPAILRLGGGKRAFGLLAVDLILPRVDMDERLALFDELVVVDVERDHHARDLRGDRDRAAVGIGIVGVLDAARRDPVIKSADGEQRQHHDADDDDGRPSLLSGFLAGGSRRGFAAVGGRENGVGLRLVRCWVRTLAFLTAPFGPCHLRRTVRCSTSSTAIGCVPLNHQIHQPCRLQPCHLQPCYLRLASAITVPDGSVRERVAPRQTPR